MEIILDWLDWPMLITTLVIATLKLVWHFIKKMLVGKEPNPVKRNEPSEENQFGDCDTAQRIIDRRRLILRAKQDAKKRPGTSTGFYCLITLLCISMLIHILLPQSIKETLDSLYPFTLLYIAWLSILLFLNILVFPLFLFNAPSWLDLIKRSRDKYSIYMSRREAMKRVAPKAAINNKETEKAEKKAIKEVEKRYRLYISQVIDVASHFDTYLLLDADSHETFLKDGVIGAKGINEGEPICKIIESYLSENDTNDPKQTQGDVPKSAQTDKDAAVVFIYSRHGKASYERTKEARTMYKDVFDLGPVCGDMRELEIVAHQLHYLQNGNCLRLP